MCAVYPGQGARQSMSYYKGLAGEQPKQNKDPG